MSQDRLTYYSEEDLTCPQCGKVHTLKRYKRINVTEKVGMKDDIMKNRLFQFHCDGCQLEAPLTYECVVLDTKGKLAVAMTPNMTPEFQADLEEYKEDKKLQKRIVDNVNDLKEKMMIADNGLDDRVIELIKIQYVGQLKDQMKDDTLMNILFDYNDKKEFCFLVFFEKKGIGRIPLAFDFYRQTERQYADKIKAAKTDDFIRVDMEWAGNLMFMRN